jgi:hypothetical protein
MKQVTLAVARNCPYHQDLARRFEDYGIPFRVEYIEENEEFRREHNLAGSPNVLVNDEVVCRGMPDRERLARIRLICGLPPDA